MMDNGILCKVCTRLLFVAWVEASYCKSVLRQPLLIPFVFLFSSLNTTTRDNCYNNNNKQSQQNKQSSPRDNCRQVKRASFTRFLCCILIKTYITFVYLCLHDYVNKNTAIQTFIVAIGTVYNQQQAVTYMVLILEYTHCSLVPQSSQQTHNRCS